MIKKIEDKDLFKNCHGKCHWVRLEEICETTSGGTPSRSITSYYDGTIPWVKSGELNDCLIYDTEEKITEQAIKNSSAKIFKPETLLIALYGATIGKLGILKISAATNQAVCAIFTTKYVDRDYLYFYLLTSRKNLIELSSGGAQPNISQEIIRRLKIPLPPLEEQKRIAALAQKADRLRRTRRYALQLSDTFLQSVFLEMFGDPITNPKGWKIKSLDEAIIDAKNGISRRRKTTENAGSIVLRIRDVGAGTIDYSEPNRITLSKNEAQDYNIKSGDLLLVRVNGNPDLVGRVAVFKQRNEPIAFNDHIIRIQLNYALGNSVYVGHLLNSPYGRAKVRKCVITTAGQFTINRSGISSISIPFPPLPLQEKFAQIVQKFERLRTQQREAERQAEHLFQTILHRAFRGELTSSDIKEEPASNLLEQSPPKQTKPETTAKAGDTSTPDTAKNPDTKAKPQDTEAIQLKLPGFE